MKTTGIFFGSTTGTTEDVAGRIASKLGIAGADVHEISSLDESVAAKYQVLLLGSSTWGCGDLQDDWYDGLDKLKKMNLKGKQIALFGTGDSSSYSDTFCDAMGVIFEGLKDCGAEFIGTVDASDYSYDDSVAVVDGRFVGLALDEVNEPSRTDERIARWTDSLAII